jgi:hypothetical protein
LDWQSLQPCRSADPYLSTTRVIWCALQTILAGLFFLALTVLPALLSCFCQVKEFKVSPLL